MSSRLRTEPKLTEAAGKTTALLQALEARMGRESSGAAAEELPDDLGQQLQQYFAAAAGSPPPARENPEALSQGLKAHLIERVVDRILERWSPAPGELSPQLKNDIIERLAERVIALLNT